MRTLSVCLSLSALAAFAVVALPAAGAVKTATVDYVDGDQLCEGFLAWDDAVTGKRPGVVARRMKRTSHTPGGSRSAGRPCPRNREAPSRRAAIISPAACADSAFTSGRAARMRPTMWAT